MNQELLQFNKENYIVTNENGQIDFIRTTCGPNNTEIILEKENLLEEYSNELKKCNDDIEKVLKEIKKIKKGKVMDYFYTILLDIAFLLILVAPGLSYRNIMLFLWSIVIGIDVHTKFKEHRKLKTNKSDLLSLEQRKNELNVNIPRLEKELKNLKEQVSYKRFNAQIVENRGLDSFQLSEPRTSYKKRVLRKKEDYNI